MSKEEIISGNKLIAEFMDAIYKPTTNGMFGSYEHFEFTKNTFDDGDFKRPYDLQYHSSWDWLIPACKKFDKLNILDAEYEAVCDEIDNAATLYEIKAAFEKLVEAIEWYNKSKK